MNFAGNIKVLFLSANNILFLTAVRLSKSVTFSISQMMFLSSMGRLGALYEKLLFLCGAEHLPRCKKSR